MEPLDPGIEAARGSAAFQAPNYVCPACGRAYDAPVNPDIQAQQISLLKEMLAATQREIEMGRLQIEAARALSESTRRASEAATRLYNLTVAPQS